MSVAKALFCFPSCTLCSFTYQLLQNCYNLLWLIGQWCKHYSSNVNILLYLLLQSSTYLSSKRLTISRYEVFYFAHYGGSLANVLSACLMAYGLYCLFHLALHIPLNTCKHSGHYSMVRHHDI